MARSTAINPLIRLDLRRIEFSQQPNVGPAFAA